ncbi:MAG: tetratricopeptide repeat protein, partial [Polyangia bacterium]|nr:tetratricopeptide repeat protein [Polyangia bacterium]
LRRMAGELAADPDQRSAAADALERIIEMDPRNEVTYRDLEEIYIKQEAWDELVSTYRRHANSAQTPPVRCEVLRAMGAVLDEKLEDPKAATDALNEALAIDSKDLQALVYLSSLLERQEEWLSLADVLSRRAELTTMEFERVELHRRIGEIALEKLGDPDTAEKRLMKALELDPENIGAMMALVTLYRNRKEWLRAASILADAERASTNRLEKARLLFDAAEIHRDQLDDLDKALGIYAKVMLVDPEHEQAASILAETHYKRGQFEEAEPLLDLLLRKVDEKQRKRKLELHVKLGLTAKRLKKVEKAIKNLEIAREMDPTSLEVLRELADLKFHMECWKDAASLFQAILVAHRDAIPTEELVQVYHRMGSVKMELGEKDKALNLFEKALALDATYEPSVKAVLILREEGGDYESIVSTKVAMFESQTDPNEKHKLAVEIGDLYLGKLDEPGKGLAYYEKAAAIKPSDRHVLHKMLESHTAKEQWDAAAKIVLRLAELESSPPIKAKYLYTAALVYRDELKNVDECIQHMEACLEADPSFELAFEAIERALTEREDWTELARALRRQYKRLPETAPAALRMSYLDRLGEIYSEKLGEVETSVAAFEAADAIDPTNSDRKAKLAHLYLQAGPDKLDKAIAQHHALLRQSPYKIQLYKDLTELYIRVKNKDATWCMCAALNFLKKASDKEQIFFDRYRPKEMVLAQRKLTDAMWRDQVRHPSESSRIDAIFAGVMQQAALMNAQPHKKFGLKRTEKVNPEEDQRPVFRSFVYAARVLDVQPRPELFTRGDQPQPIQVANATEKGSLLPTWLVDAEKFDAKSQREVVFEVARQLAHMRPERYLWRALVSQTDLFNVLFAALSIMVPDAQLPDSPEVGRIATNLKKTVPPLVFEQLLPVAKELLSAGAEEANLANWILATQRTGLRAALLLTNDFGVVAKVVATEPDGVTGLAAKDRVADLLQFSVSPEYFALRAHLGFDVK